MRFKVKYQKSGTSVSKSQSAELDPFMRMHKEGDALLIEHCFEKADLTIDWLVNDFIHSRGNPWKFDHSLVMQIVDSAGGQCNTNHNRKIHLKNRYEYIVKPELPSYLSDFASSRGGRENVIDLFRELYRFVADNIIGSSLIDAGSSDGVLGYAVAALRPEIKVILSDLEPNLIARDWLCEETGKFLEHIVWDITGDNRTDSYNANKCSADTVSCLFVLEHIDSDKWRQSIEEIWKASAKRLIIAVPVECSDSMLNEHKGCFTGESLRSMLPEDAFVQIPVESTRVVIAVLDRDVERPVKTEELERLVLFEKLNNDYQNIEQYDDLKRLEAAVFKYPGDIHLNVLLAMAYQRSDRYEDMNTVIERLNYIEPWNVSARILQGSAAIKNGRYKEAEEQFRLAGNLNSISGELLEEVELSVAVLKLNDGEVEKALDGFKKIIKNNDRNFRAYGAAADALWQLGCLDKAIRYAETAIAKAGKWEEMKLKLSIWLKELDRTGEAIEILLQLTKTGNAEAWRRLGDINLQSGTYSEAARAYGNALKIDRHDKNAWLGLAAMAGKTGRRRASVCAMEKALSYSMNNGRMIAWVQDIASLEKYDLAMELAEKINAENSYEQNSFEEQAELKNSIDYTSLMADLCASGGKWSNAALYVLHHEQLHSGARSSKELLWAMQCTQKTSIKLKIFTILVGRMPGYITKKTKELFT